MSALQTSIENLYEIFASYRVVKVDGCPCCISEEDKKKLLSKPLHTLEEMEIGRYAFKAMTTWGTENDFKHFLPRIFELMSSRTLGVCTFIILNKLEYAKWELWRETEREAVKLFLREWAYHLLNSEGIISEVEDIVITLRELDIVLEGWNIDFDKSGFRNLIEEINFQWLFNKKETKYSDFGKAYRDWLFSKMDYLERAFYYFEKSDPDFAGYISDAHQMLGWRMEKNRA